MASDTFSSSFSAARARSLGEAYFDADADVSWEVPASAPHVVVQSDTMTGRTGPAAPKNGVRSYGCMGVPSTDREAARLIGALDLRRIDVWFELVAGANGLRIVPTARTDGLDAREAGLPMPRVVALEGPSLSELYARYGDLSGRAMAARVPPRPVRGWCSWYYYYGRETERDVLDEASTLREREVLPPGAVIQIDDGWNLPTPNAPRNWGDWFPGSKFPGGMRAVADAIHALDFRAGLWLAPFAADSASDLARNHPDWLLQSASDALLDEGENPVSGLDLTHPEVLAFLETTFDRVFNEWGFDYVKLDFLMDAMAEGPRHDPGTTRAAACHEALRRIRRVAGDRFILACGSPLGPAVGQVDAMRVGFDTGSRWHAPMMSHLWPHGNCSVKPAAHTTLHRQWMNGNWWLNDPDCLVARPSANAYEPLQFDASHPGGDTPAEAFGLSAEEAGFWARLVHVVGTSLILSEIFEALPDDRQDLVRRALREPETSFGPVEWPEGNDVSLMLRGNGEPAAALFNLGDAPARVRRPADHPDGTYAEAFSDELWEADADASEFPELPPRAARIWRPAP